MRIIEALQTFFLLALQNSSFRSQASRGGSGGGAQQEKGLGSGHGYFAMIDPYEHRGFQEYFPCSVRAYTGSLLWRNAIPKIQSPRCLVPLGYSHGPSGPRLEPTFYTGHLESRPHTPYPHGWTQASRAASARHLTEREGERERQGGLYWNPSEFRIFMALLEGCEIFLFVT